MTEPRFDADAAFEGATVPPWLARFAASPMEAMDDLLFGRAALGRLGGERPAVLLLDWVVGLADRGGFHAALDAALAAWVAARWRQYTYRDLPVVLTTSAWCEVTEVIAAGRLSRSALALAARLRDDTVFLGALAEGRGRDPLYGAWLALSVYQEDDTWMEQWWCLVRVDGAKPWYWGEAGIWGLARMPDVKHRELVLTRALRAWAQAMAPLVRDGLLDGNLVWPEVPRLWRRLREVLPQASAWDELIDVDDRLDPPEGAMPVEGPPRITSERLAFREDLRQIHDALRLEEPDAVERATQQWSRCRAGLRDTGEADHHAGDVFTLALALPPAARGLARRWLAMARPMEPAGSNLMFEVELAARDQAYVEAVTLGATQFLDGPELGGYHQTIQYADALLNAGLWQRAIWVFRYAYRTEFTFGFARGGLVGALVGVGEMEEALAIVQIQLEVDWECHSTWRLYISLLLQVGRADDARRAAFEAQERAGMSVSVEDIVRQMERTTPKGPPTPASDALARAVVPLRAEAGMMIEMIRAACRDPSVIPARWRAHAFTLRDALAVHADVDPGAAERVGSLAIAEGQLDDAARLLRRAHTRFPGSARVLLALAQAERRRGEVVEAARLYASLDRNGPGLHAIRLLGALRTSGTISADLVGRFGWALHQGELRADPWVKEVDTLVFQGTKVTGARDVTDVSVFAPRLSAAADRLDELEMAWTARHAPL